MPFLTRLLWFLPGILTIAGCHSGSENFTTYNPKTGIIQHQGIDLKPNTPAGKYDRALINKIAETWYKLIGDRYRSKAGNLTLEFNLLSNGSVANLKVAGQDSNLPPELIDYCRQAVLANSPYSPFPKELASAWGNQRLIKITFRYNY